MPLVVRAFPVTSGRDEIEEFVKELTERRSAETDAFYRRFGVSREAWFWQDTPHGPLIIAVTEAADPISASEAYARADEPFESWFKGEALRHTGMDLNTTPLGPPSEKVFDWSDKAQG